MEPQNRRYGPVLFLQYIMILGDLMINAAAPLLYPYNTVQLVLYVMQDTCTVMALIIIFLSFFATFVFQAGLISVLISKFRTTIFATCFYLALSIPFHVWSLQKQWDRPFDYIWTPGLITLYVAQRTASVFHYHFYKRAALLLGDPKFHQDSPWLRDQIEKRT